MEEKSAIKKEIETITTHVTELFQAQKELVLVSVAIKGSEIASSIILGVLVFLLSIIFLFFAAIALGFWLSDILNNQALGFLAAGFVFLFIGLLCIALRKSLLTSFKNTVVKLIYDRSNHL